MIIFTAQGVLRSVRPTPPKWAQAHYTPYSLKAIPNLVGLTLRHKPQRGQLPAFPSGSSL